MIMKKFFNILVFGFCIIFLSISCKSRSYTVIENSDGVTLFHEGKVILKVIEDEDSIKLNIRDSELILNLEENFIISGLIKDPSVDIAFNSSEIGVVNASIKDKRNCGIIANFPYTDNAGSFSFNTPDYGLITQFEMYKENPFIAHEERIKDEIIAYEVDEKGIVSY